MAPRITIIGGGSYQWVPKLLVDLANTPSLHDSELALEDIDPNGLPRMAAWVERINELRGTHLSARTTTDQRAALEAADFVVVTISTGGFTSMRQDLEVPARYGIKQSVGDTVGPGGVMRGLRNIPVFLGIARDMSELCPDAWLLNITNPMTTICRSVTRESSIKTIGLCHEVTITQFILSLLLDADFREIEMEVMGVNHLPIVTRLDIGGRDGFELLRELLDDLDRRGPQPLAMPFPEGLGHERISEGGDWTHGDLVAANKIKLELFQRFGVLPAAGDRHLAEFFPGFLTEESEWGKRWGVHLTTIEDRERGQQGHIDDLDAMMAAPEVSSMPSGELVAALIDSMLRDKPRHMPLNIPNSGQCPDLPLEAVVESICTVDGNGVRGRHRASAPPGLAEHVRRVSASQELVVEAAVSGDRERAFEAMLADPLAGRIDFDAVDAMTSEMLEATKHWLPQFS
jgi:alpha-galactosidase